MNIKKTFLAGLATILPIAITLFIVHFFLDLLTTPFLSVVEELLSNKGGEFFNGHRHLLVFSSQIVIVIAFIALIFLVGILGRRYLFSLFLKTSEALFKRIPIVKTIYKITRDVTKNVFKAKKETLFKKTVMVPFPTNNTHVLGLMSGPAPDAAKEANSPVFKEKKFNSIFVPTAPHPISGFLVLYSEEETRTLDIPTEDVFKFLLSCGIYDPKDKPDEGE